MNNKIVDDISSLRQSTVSRSQFSPHQSITGETHMTRRTQIISDFDSECDNPSIDDFNPL